MLTVGIPKEVKPREKRVALTPTAVKELCGKGVSVYVEKAAGEESGFNDEQYKINGAQIVESAEEIYETAELIVKVKEPQSQEYPLIQPKHWLFCFLHLASPENCELVSALCQSKCHAIAFETVRKEKALPLLKPMSEIAGGLAALYGALIYTHEMVRLPGIKYPEEFQQKLELLGRQFPSCPADFKIGNVVIYGAGIAGMRAYDLAMKMGGKVTLIEMNDSKRSFLQSSGVLCLHPKQIPKSILEKADVIIGCAHSAGKRAAEVMSIETLKLISEKHKKILLDVSIDQGGNFPEAKSTTYDEPLYRDSFGNLRFAVANLPSLCGPTASQKLSEAVLPYTMALAKDPEEANIRFPELKQGLNIVDGRIVLNSVATAHKKLD